MKTEFETIKEITGREPSECSCKLCQSQCMSAPCLGTPADMERIIDAGYGAFLEPTIWGAGKLLGVTDKDIQMYSQNFDEKDGCIFLEEGKCILHDKGLKPTEGRLSHHSQKLDNFVPSKSISWNVAKEWTNPANFPTMLRVQKKYEMSIAVLIVHMKQLQTTKK